MSNFVSRKRKFGDPAMNMNLLQALLPPIYQCQLDCTLLDDDPTLSNLLCRIHVATEALSLGSECRVISLVLFHRFMATYVNLLVRHEGVDQSVFGPVQSIFLQNTIFNSMIHKRYLGSVAATCIFLACKMENQPRRIRDIVNLSHMLDFSGQHWGVHNFSDSTHVESHDSKGLVHIVEAACPPPLDEDYWDAKQRIVSTEQVLLRFLTFDAQVPQPHRILVVTLDHLFSPRGNQRDQDHICGQDEFHSVYLYLLRNAWRKINDALFYPPCLRIPVLHLVCASIQISMQECMRDCQQYKDVVSNIMDEQWRTITMSEKDLEKSMQVVQKSTSLKSIYK